MTAGQLDLNGIWELYQTEDFPAFLNAETLPGRHAFKAAVPAPIHTVLMDASVLEDVNTGLNSLRARWVEEQIWGYRRTFATSKDYVAGTPAWLVFDKLELNATVYLNGKEIGSHANAHLPARFLVTEHLRSDGSENVLVVVIESGLYATTEKAGRDYRDTPQARLTKIHWQRRGQWQRGWDWQARLLNIGILGDVRLEWSPAPFVASWSLYATVSEDMSQAVLHASVEILNGGIGTATSTLRLSHTAGTDGGGDTEIPVTIPPGTSRHEIVSPPISNPVLWWPVGHGEPYQYPISLYFNVPGKGGLVETHGKKIGIRKVEVDQSPHPVEGTHFTLKINDRPIFCKGGNWVPADMLHSTVTPERFRELADLALEANFNMLRIWGGGVYADPALLDYCDENGLLVWHDLLFACSKYPGDDPTFVAEVRQEVTWAIREMAHHASLVVWCGNNEIEEGDWHWGWDRSGKVAPHYALFHHDLPQIAAREDPSKFYWISSPYSQGYASPRDPTVGDQHPWKVSLQVAGGADWWEYRKMVDRFPNEGGVLGCSSPATLREFLPANEQYLLSPSWEHHDNPFAINDTPPGKLGHAYQTVSLWTGLDPLALDLDRYAFVSGLLHAEGLTEYITNFRRRMFSSSAAIFWMYNDSWPVTHGWTIVDYYRRKKLAYHPVRRAFEPVSVVCWFDEQERSIRFTGINEGATTWRGHFSCGLFDTRGVKFTTPERRRLDNTLGTFDIAPNSATTFDATKLLPSLEQAGFDRTGLYATLADSSGHIIAQHRLFFARFGELDIVREPQIEMSLENDILTLKSDVFVWGVCLDVDGERPVADNCFDLLPGVPYRLPWDKSILGEPRILRTGNRDALPSVSNGGV